MDKREVIADGRQRPDWTALTARERQIARLSKRHLTQEQIGKKLGISTRTVEYHTRQIRVKTGAPTTRQAVFGIRSIVRGPQPLGRTLRFAILDRDKFTCRYCGRKAPDVEIEVDHILARARGGEDDPSNLVTACVDCNLGKADRPLQPVD